MKGIEFQPNLSNHFDISSVHCRQSLSYLNPISHSNPLTYNIIKKLRSVSGPGQLMQKELVQGGVERGGCFVGAPFSPVICDILSQH